MAASVVGAAAPTRTDDAGRTSTLTASRRLLM
jgi:hypothetical protein